MLACVHFGTIVKLKNDRHRFDLKIIPTWTQDNTWSSGGEVLKGWKGSHTKKCTCVIFSSSKWVYSHYLERAESRGSTHFCWKPCLAQQERTATCQVVTPPDRQSAHMSVVEAVVNGTQHKKKASDDVEEA